MRNERNFSRPVSAYLGASFRRNVCCNLRKENLNDGHINWSRGPHVARMPQVHRLYLKM